MKWLQLKLQMLPIIASEIELQIKEYKRLVQQTCSVNADRQAINDAGITAASAGQLIEARMRADFKTRMEELSVFYDANLDDPKAQFLEKLRLKLKRALQYKVSYENRVKNTPLGMSVQHTSYSQNLSTSHRRDDISSTSTSFIEEQDEEYLESSVAQSSKKVSIHSSLARGQQNHQPEPSVVEEEFQDYRDDEDFPPHINRASEGSHGNSDEFKEEEDYFQESQHPVQIDMQQQVQVNWQEELVFRIKLTRDEYELYLREKASRGQPMIQQRVK